MALELASRIRYYIEAARRAISLDELPPKYRRLKLLGKGATSLVMEAPNGNVLMFTRDKMKAEWLTLHGMGIAIGNTIDSFTGHKVKDKSLHELDIQVVELPRLYKLSPTNKRIVNAEVVQFIATREKVYIDNRKSFTGNANKDHLFNIKLWNYYAEHFPDSLVGQALEFGANYEPTFNWDIVERNFMETKDGKLVLVDPVVSNDIMAYIHGYGGF